MVNQETMYEAVQCFGGQIVSEVIETVRVSDPDCMYSTYQDMGMDEHAECVEMLFFA